MDCLYTLLINGIVKEEEIALEILDNLDIAKIVLDDEENWTFAHFCALSWESCCLKSLDNFKIARLANKKGMSVAHMAVTKCELSALKSLDNLKIAKLADKNGSTVAHVAATYKTVAFTILKNPKLFSMIKNRAGVSVLQTAKEQLSN